MRTEKRNLQEKLTKRKIHKPWPPLYYALVGIIRVLFFKKFGVRIRYKIRPRDIPSPYIVVSNHASRMDYIYSCPTFFPHTLNYVVGYNEFFRSHLAGLFRMAQVIPKKNFIPDPQTIREMSRIIKEGGRVILFPEGMSSISGSNQPCAAASGKFLKHFKLPVLRMKISGGYLTSPKFSLRDRPGRVEVEVDRLFTPEDLEAMDADTIQLKLDEALAHDDYAWNKKARVSYNGGGALAQGLHTLLYWCPKCGGEFCMKGEGNRITCSRCGNGAEFNEFYDLIPLDSDCVIPETPRIWYDMQRKRVREWIGKGDFELRENVKLGVLPTDHYLLNQATSELVGQGEILLNRQGFFFNGQRQGRPFSFSIPPEQLPTYGMCTDVSRFYTFYQGEFLEFYPAQETVAKWFLATEENHRFAGGSWKDFPDAEAHNLPKDLEELYGIFEGKDAPNKKELRKMFHEKNSN
jgi:1-acyl-sn-glycerol-3-phosphate acyltransferase/ribosomal protein S27AE